MLHPRQIDTNLIELSNKGYACAIVMPLKNNIFGNWIEKTICWNYHQINKKTKLDRNLMLTLEELFDAIKIAQVLSTL